MRSVELRPDAGTDDFLSIGVLFGHITRSEPMTISIMRAGTHDAGAARQHDDHPGGAILVETPPLASTYTAERAAYRTCLKFRAWRGRFDIAECANNPYNDWIGAQIRADVYGWVCPGNLNSL